VGFNDPIVGGQYLRRASIRSPNYITGVSGWTINQDGTAEFNNTTIRGSLLVIGTDGSQVSVEVPGTGVASIVATPAPIPGHTVQPSTIDTFTDMPFGPGIEVASPTMDSGASSLLILGGANPGGVGTQLFPYAELHTGRFRLDLFPSAGMGAWNVELEGNGGAGLIIEHPLGNVATMYYTGGTGATSAGAVEAALVAWTGADAVGFQPGRAYEIEVSGGAFASAAAATELAVIRLRSAVNSTVAQLLGEVRVPVQFGATVVTFKTTFYVRNATAARIDKPSLGVGVARVAGAANHSVFGNAGNFPLLVVVKDYGNAADTQLGSAAVAIT
jgi:hypothetical protein